MTIVTPPVFPLSALWVYISKTLNLSLPLPGKLLDQVWKFILRMHKHFQFYELPVERETVVLFDRYQLVDSDLGVPITPVEFATEFEFYTLIKASIIFQDICPAIRYKCVPISEGEIIGSCEYYKERKLVPLNLIEDLDVEAVFKMWVFLT